MSRKDESVRAAETKATLIVTMGYSLYELRLAEQHDFTISGVLINFRPATEAEVSRGFKKYTVFVSGHTQRTVNERMRAALTELESNRLPPGTSDWDSPDGTFRAGDDFGNWVLPRRILPPALRDAFDELSAQIRHAVDQAVQLVRWRSGTQRMYRPLAVVMDLCRWSLDGTAWHSVPSDTSASIEDTSLIPFGSELRGEVQRLADASQSEPIAHELWREAWALRGQGPRSALVIGIAAAEVGFKNLVSELVPDAGWLVENVPTPPLEKMLREFLPTLPARNKIGGKVVPPHPDALDLLKKAVLERNKATHVGAAVQTDRVEEILGMVRDLLWLFDFYRGDAWALHLCKKPPAE